jgi:hypothetical protein
MIRLPEIWEFGSIGKRPRKVGSGFVQKIDQVPKNHGKSKINSKGLHIIIDFLMLVLDILPDNSLGLEAKISIPGFEPENPSGDSVCRFPLFIQFQIPASQKWLCD